MLKSKSQSGIAHLGLIILIIILAAIGFTGWRVVSKDKSSSQTANTGQTSASSKKSESDLLYLKTIGFNFDNYNPATNRAGDMVFTHADHDLSGHFHLIFSDFGTQDPRSPTDPSKRNVQPTFVLPLGTKVLSLVDGVVSNVETLYSNDSTIMVTSTGENTSYIYETEHIINPLVKKGDQVKGGQVIGEVSTHDSQYHPGFGIVEIGILHPVDNQAAHICPFYYLDSSVKADIQKKIINVHKAWMEYTGLPNLYDDAHAAEPGCFITDPVKG